ncbi:MAG: hypothetical protein SFU87_06670 [Chitinophagaceae bacterium]|nr:hypothetical protein [Chitinophagaceae bacterium]
MEKNPETIIAEFNNIAASIYTATFDQFCESFRQIDRKRDENVFRLQAAKYSDTLKYRLEEQAKEILESYHSPGISAKISPALSATIHYFLQEFRHRSNAL